MRVARPAVVVRAVRPGVLCAGSSIERYDGPRPRDGGVCVCVQLAEMTNLCRELKMRDGFETRGGGGGGGGGRRGSASSASSIRMLKVTSRWWDRGIDDCYDYSYDCE